MMTIIMLLMMTYHHEHNSSSSLIIIVDDEYDRAFTAPWRLFRDSFGRRRHRTANSDVSTMSIAITSNGHI
jgi:hypothetical protein